MGFCSFAVTGVLLALQAGLFQWYIKNHLGPEATCELGFGH